MNTQDRIAQELIEASKARDTERTSTLRMLRSVLKNAQIEKMQQPLSEDEVLALIAREVKKLKDARESFVSGNRQDLTAQTDREIALLEVYLPKQIDESELRLLTEEHVKSMGQVSQKDFGRVMSEIMKKVQGRADGNRVSAAVKEMLAKIL